MHVAVTGAATTASPDALALLLILSVAFSIGGAAAFLMTTCERDSMHRSFLFGFAGGMFLSSLNALLLWLIL